MVTNLVLSVCSFKPVNHHLTVKIVRRTLGRLCLPDIPLSGWAKSSPGGVACLFRHWDPVPVDDVLRPYADAELKALPEGRHQVYVFRS